jgi:lysyl endopeptidase
MCKANFVVLSRVAMGMIALVVGFAAPPSLWAKGFLENPQASSARSGIGVISGWVCDASSIDLIIDEGTPLAVPYGTDREDTVGECGDANNGFGLLLNWNLLGDGPHTIRALADGVQFGSATFTVTTMMGEEFLKGASGSVRLPDFPWPGTTVTIRWDESSQNFVIESIEVDDVLGVGVGPF